MVIAKDRAKNKSSRLTLPLVPQYRELLLRMKQHQDECRKLCGRSYHESEYIYVNDIGDSIKPNYITQHFGSILEKSGIAMKDIQVWLGHSTYNTTAEFYAHLDAASKDNTGAAMAEAMDISGALIAVQG